MQKRKGISLIVLVITIIVMIVLAGAIILSLNNSGIINKSNEAVDLTNIANVREFAQTKWAEAYLELETKTQEALEEYVLDELDEADITIDDYEIEVTEKGVTVNKKGEVKIITFTMHDREFKAEEGMTWEQWEKSIYNTVGMKEFIWDEDDGSSYSVQYYFKDGVCMLAEGIEVNEENKWMSLEYKITPGARYLGDILEP